MGADAGRAGAPEELLEASWTQRGRSVHGRELRLELTVTAAFLAAVAALVAVAPPGRGPQAIAAAVVVAYALANRARFPVGTGHAAPTQLFLVPLFFLAPAQLVPALVFAGLVIGTGGATLARRSSIDRLVYCGGDALHVLGPALVLTALAGGDAREAGPMVLALAFAAQLAFDLGSSILHDRLVFGSRPEVHLKVLLEIWSVDAALAPVGLVAARVAESVGWAALAPLGLVPLLGAMAAERSRRIDEAHARLVALDLERGRHLEAVQRIGDALVSNLDVDTLLETVARSAEEALEGESRLDGWGDVAVVVAERRATRSSGPAVAEHDGVHAIACSVGDATQPLSMVSVARSRPFADEDRTLLHHLCQQATASAENVGRHERLLLAEERLRHQAFHDALTELPNRHLFTDRVEHALRRHARAPGAVAILFIDLDGFKLANDSLGHDAGDELLVAVAQRLRASLRDGDTAARFGGDEFAVLLEDVTGAEQAAVVAERVRRALASPVEIRGRDLVVRASVGLALAEPELDCEALLRRADLAMYAAKRDGGDRVEMFYPELLVSADTRTELVEDLGYAVERREFELHYQPIVDLGTDTVTAVEALVRWRHPRRGLLGPGHFIELAEETGIIGELGRYVMDEACRAAASWPATTGRSPRVSVNVSPAQLSDPSFTADVAGTLRRHGLPAKRLTLEVTESVAMDAMGPARATLQQLRELGVTVALDDFGTGFSSLSYLARFSVDLLKLDRTFLADVEEDAAQARLVGGVIQLARSLGVPVVAEGIERPGQLARMRELGADLGQGYFIGGPMDGVALVGHLAGTDAPAPRIALAS